MYIRYSKMVFDCNSLKIEACMAANDDDEEEEVTDDLSPVQTISLLALHFNLSFLHCTIQWTQFNSIQWDANDVVNDFA